MLINNKHITPFFSSTYSSYLEKRFKKNFLSVKGTSYLSPGLRDIGTFLPIKGKKATSFNLPNSKEKVFFNNKKNPFFESPNTLIGSKINNSYYTIQNQKLNKIILDLQKFLKKNFFPVSSHLGTLPIKKDKFKNSSILPFYKKLIKGFIGKELNAHNQQLIHSKSITYSFKNNNNTNSLLSSTKLIDNLLKKFFISIGTLISKPTYLNRQDKIIIRLFVYFSPKLNLFLKTSLLNQNSWKVISKEQMILNSSTPIKVNNYNPINIGETPNPKDLNNNTEGYLMDPLFNFISNINKVEGALANKKNQILFSSFSMRQKNKSWSSLLSNYTKKIASNLLYLNSPLLPPTVKKYKKDSLILSNPSLLQGSLPLSKILIDNGIKGKGMTKNNLPEPTFIKGSLFNYESYFTLFKPYLENFSLILGSIFNKKVELEIVKLQFPFHDSYILAQILGINANKYNFTLMVKKILQLSHLKNPSKNIWYTKVKKDEKLESKINPSLFDPSSYLPALFSVEGLNTKWLKKIRTLKMIGNKGKYNSLLSGMSIRLGGRLMTQSIRPRFTTQSMQNGSLARVKVDFVDKSRFTGKNKRGTFSFTVSVSHIIHK